MLLLPADIVAFLAPFAPLFSRPVWRHVQVLVVGAILAPGRRLVSTALRAVGLSHLPHFAPSTVHIFGFPLPPQIQAISGLTAILSQQHQRREIATDRMSFPLSALESSSSLLTYQGLGHRAISIVGCYKP
jgi:hypothetical protein